MKDHTFSTNDNGLILGEESYAVVGAAMEVYYKLGSGFLEPVYQQALDIEFSKRNIPFISQKRFKINYKGVLLDH